MINRSMRALIHVLKRNDRVLICWTLLLKFRLFERAILFLFEVF